MPESEIFWFDKAGIEPGPLRPRLYTCFHHKNALHDAGIPARSKTGGPVPYASLAEARIFRQCSCKTSFHMV